MCDGRDYAAEQREYRRQQADLPFEEKVRLVVAMQEVAREWAMQAGRPEPFVWALPPEERVH